MHPDLLQLGSIIKKRRTEKGLSLKEIENVLSIRVAHLQAIEEGQLGKLISPIYAQGFLTKYISFLEMDPHQLLKQHPYVLHLLQDQPSQEADFDLGLHSVETRSSSAGNVKHFPALLWVALALFALGAGWLIARYFQLI